MPDFRLFVTHGLAQAVLLQFTFQKDDRSFQGVWSKPNIPHLIFADHTRDGNTFSYHGGPVAGAPIGHPLQLVFWGGWWAGAGAPVREFIETRTRAMLHSPYFSELAQYGVPRAPIWGGSTTVIQPAAPASAPTVRSISEQVVDLIDDLIDDDVFPDPDEGPRMLFVVVLPDGFTLGQAAGGAHRYDYDFDFPFDSDNYWAGWVRPNADRDRMMRVISHEVVEMMTDPELDAWHTEVDSPTNEISDAGFSGGTPAMPNIAQAAFVNGARVQSYWSNKHGAPIIPIDRDYSAQLKARIQELSRHEVGSGTFTINDTDRVGCPTIPECCIDDRDYAWRVDGLNERARVTLEVRRYASPIATWSINGIPVAGASTITLNLDVEEFFGRDAVVKNRPVTLRYSATNMRLDVFAENVDGNCEVEISCSVRDGSITGNLATDVIATPTITLGFTCAELLLDDSYNRQKSACLTAMVKRYVVNYKPMGKINPEEGINWDPAEILHDRPAYFRPSHYERLRWMAKAGRAAHALLDARSATEFTDALMTQAPALAQNLHVTSVKRERLRRDTDTSPAVGCDRSSSIPDDTSRAD